jgi:AbrB family looped-hinge helix DNA binding protein
MKEAKILNIDKRGRIVIPNIYRKSLGIEEATQIMMIADSDRKEIRIYPVAWSGERETVKLKIYMEDVAGSLAKVAKIIGELKISLIYGEAIVIERGKSAIWTVIAPLPEGINTNELVDTLLKKGNALKVEILE